MVRRDYGIEVWSKNGTFVADISRMVTNRKFTMQRNDYETLEGNIDLDVLNAYAASIGEHPRNVLMPLQNNLRLRQTVRGADTYLFGAQITSSPPTLDV